jgi:hypothetical protein
MQCCRINLTESISVICTNLTYCSSLHKKTNKQTPRSESVSKLYQLSVRCLLANLVKTFVHRGCRVVSVMDPYGRILYFIEPSRYIFFKYLLNCTHEAEWTPFQIHYFSENLVVPGIEPGSLDLQLGALTTRPQRQSTFFHITYINSVHTSQEIQYISVLWTGTH